MECGLRAPAGCSVGPCGAALWGVGVGVGIRGS